MVTERLLPATRISSGSSTATESSRFCAGAPSTSFSTWTRTADGAVITDPYDTLATCASDIGALRGRNEQARLNRRLRASGPYANPSDSAMDFWILFL